ncbi:MAG: DUF167 domain-containing protein [Candidatus Paceibacterota bacterium]
MYVKIQVTPDARKERFEQVNETEFRASVKEPRERNLANRRVAALIAEHYRIGSKQVRLVSGHRSHGKVFDVSLAQ